MRNQIIPLLCLLALLFVGDQAFAGSPVSKRGSTLQAKKYTTASLQQTISYAKGMQKKLQAKETVPVMPVSGRITSRYGPRRLASEVRVRTHAGIDISAPKGSPVVAAAPGTVIHIGIKGAYGKVIEIDHGNGLVTRYAHLDSYGVKKGEMVQAGTRIGTVGRTGRTTGPNLHFEARLKGKAVNPLLASTWRQAPAHWAVKNTLFVAGRSFSFTTS